MAIFMELISPGINHTHNRALGITSDFSQYITDPGAGYTSAPPALAVAATFSTQAFPVAMYSRGEVWALEIKYLDLLLSSGGSGYSDDAMVVIAPPHTNDFQILLDDSTCDTIQLEEGLYFQNVVVTRDLTIK